MHKVHSESTDKLGELLDKHSSLFEERLVKITGTTAKLYMNSDAPTQILPSLSSTILHQSQGGARD